jgi:hypothetical protein
MRRHYLPGNAGLWRRSALQPDFPSLDDLSSILQSIREGLPGLAPAFQDYVTSAASDGGPNQIERLNGLVCIAVYSLSL